MIGASQNHQGLFGHFGHLPSPQIEAPKTPSFLISDEGVGCGIGVIKVTRRETGTRDEDFTFDANKSSGKVCTPKNVSGKKAKNESFQCERMFIFFLLRSNIYILIFFLGTKSHPKSTFLEVPFELVTFPNSQTGGQRSPAGLAYFTKSTCFRRSERFARGATFSKFHLQWSEDGRWALRMETTLRIIGPSYGRV